MIEQFYKPGTIEEALDLKDKFKECAVFLAGGTLVNSKDFPFRYENIISLEGLKLNQIANTQGEVRIGALCTLEELSESSFVPHCLKEAVAQVVSRNIRNLATAGGHIAARKSCSDLLPLLIALEAQLQIHTPAAETMLLEVYLQTRPEGLITEIILQKTHLSRLHSAGCLRASANSRSTLTVAASLQLDDGVVHDPIIVLGGVGRKLTRLTIVETQLQGKPMPHTDKLVQLVRENVEHSSCRPTCIGPCIWAGIEEDADYLQYQAGMLVASTLRKACRGKGACL